MISPLPLIQFILTRDMHFSLLNLSYTEHNPEPSFNSSNWNPVICSLLRDQPLHTIDMLLKK